MGHIARTSSLILAAATAVMLSGCGQVVPPHMRAIPAETVAMMAEKGMREDAPIFVRIFKQESELEIWKATDDGLYHHLKTYPICNYSGKLGPKIKQGDKQSPEGFYKVSSKLMNPNSKYHLSFNLGYPNKFDKSRGRTGDYLMVHGDCRSAGCYAMTDALIEEIYALAREALKGGQEAFDVHAYPFRMTPENMQRYKGNKNYNFWRTLQVGYSHFEYTHKPPKVDVCEKRYLVNVAFKRGGPTNPSAACPIHEALPLEAAPQPPLLQEARIPQATPKKRPPHMAFAPASSAPQSVDASSAPHSSAVISTPSAGEQASISRGGLFGFGLAPAKPSFSGFAFRSNAKLGK